MNKEARAKEITQSIIRLLVTTVERYFSISFTNEKNYSKSYFAEVERKQFHLQLYCI